MTVKEGQNIEMACAFQSGTSSVYLEIQWWFVKTPEPIDSEEDVDAEEVQKKKIPKLWQFCFKHTHSKKREKKGHPISSALLRTNTLGGQTSSSSSSSSDSRRSPDTKSKMAKKKKMLGLKLL